MARKKKDNTLLFLGLGLLAFTLLSRRTAPTTGTPNTLPGPGAGNNNQGGTFWSNLPNILGGVAEIIESTGSGGMSTPGTGGEGGSQVIIRNPV